MNWILWMKHVNWTRMTIISIVFGLPDLPFVQEWLLQNATDLGNYLRPFYGDQIADRYAELIKEHLLIDAQLVTAAAKGDAATADAKEKEWYRNADDIAIFLRGSTKNVLHTFSFNKKRSRNYDSEKLSRGYSSF